MAAFERMSNLDMALLLLLSYLETPSIGPRGGVRRVDGATDKMQKG
jgi:hypothetical protein